MALPPQARDWMDRAEIDYIGPFVKAWAAFNAWYRHASGKSRERDMLDFVKSRPNPVRGTILALLRNDNETADALSLKQAISDLQLKLDAIHFEVMRKGVNEQISLRTVCIRPRNLNNHHYRRHNYEYRAERVQGGGIQITVTALQTAQVKFQHTQALYDPNEVYALREFTANLSEAQRATLRQFYDGCNPRPMSDLVKGDGPALTIAAMEFRCTEEDLLAGLVETIYAMRNALLHGEVEPGQQVLACYEPAYHIVISFLNCIR